MTTAKTTEYGFIVFLLAAAMIGCPGPSSKAMIPELVRVKSSVDLCAKEGTFVHSVLCPKSQSLLILLLSFGKY
ncbi:hypothetical protein HQ584_08380, partial [Patescibacteria group bacterium]|nr:hypothetical protein [Patescibacteria group bacterium]